MTQLSTTPGISLLTQQPCTRGNHAAIQELLFFAQKNQHLTAAQACNALDAASTTVPSGAPNAASTDEAQTSAFP